MEFRIGFAVTRMRYVLVWEKRWRQFKLVYDSLCRITRHFSSLFRTKQVNSGVFRGFYFEIVAKNEVDSRYVLHPTRYGEGKSFGFRESAVDHVKLIEMLTKRAPRDFPIPKQ